MSYNFKTYEDVGNEIEKIIKSIPKEEVESIYNDFLIEFLKDNPDKVTYVDDQDYDAYVSGRCPYCGRCGDLMSITKHVHISSCHKCKTKWYGNDVITGLSVRDYEEMSPDEFLSFAKKYAVYGVMNYKEVEGIFANGQLNLINR